MCVKVVADKDDLFCIGVILIHQPLYLMGPVTLFSGFIDGAPPPSAQRFVEHEGAAGAFSLVLMVLLPYMVGFGHLYRLVCVSMQFYGLLVHTDEGDFRIIRSGIQLQYILHGRYECGVLVGWNAPHLLQVRLKFVFLVSSPPACARWSLLSPVRRTFRKEASESISSSLPGARYMRALLSWPRLLR